jgi:hypothetical protein
MQGYITYLTGHHLPLQQLLLLLLLLALCSALCHERQVVCCCLRSKVLARLSLQPQSNSSWVSHTAACCSLTGHAKSPWTKLKATNPQNHLQLAVDRCEHNKGGCNDTSEILVGRTNSGNSQRHPSAVKPEVKLCYKCGWCPASHKYRIPTSPSCVA